MVQFKQEVSISIKHLSERYRMFMHSLDLVQPSWQVVMVEEIEFDEEVKCTHVYHKSCFESYTTTFKKTKV